MPSCPQKGLAARTRLNPTLIPRPANRRIAGKVLFNETDLGTLKGSRLRELQCDVRFMSMGQHPGGVTQKAQIPNECRDCPA
jgi:hypothetical protein